MNYTARTLMSVLANKNKMKDPPFPVWLKTKGVGPVRCVMHAIATFHPSTIFQEILRFMSGCHNVTTLKARPDE